MYALSNTALRTLSTDSPDIISLVFLVIALTVSIKVLDYMRRAIIYWISVAVRLSIYAALLGIGVYMWQRGLDQSLEDFGWLWGLLEGFTEEGQRIGNRRARGSERQAHKHTQVGRKDRTRGAGW